MGLRSVLLGAKRSAFNKSTPSVTKNLSRSRCSRCRRTFRKTKSATCAACRRYGRVFKKDRARYVANMLRECEAALGLCEALRSPLTLSTIDQLHHQQHCRCVFCGMRLSHVPSDLPSAVAVRSAAFVLARKEPLNGFTRENVVLSCTTCSHLRQEDYEFGEFKTIRQQEISQEETHVSLDWSITLADLSGL